MEEWISAATIAHIYGKETQDEDEFVVANGREFRRQVHDADSTSTEISRTFSTCISRAFPEVVKALRLNIPISTLEQNIVNAPSQFSLDLMHEIIDLKLLRLWECHWELQRF